MTYRSEEVSALKNSAKEAMIFANGEIASMWKEGWDLNSIRIAERMAGPNGISFEVIIQFRKEVKAA